MHGVSVNPFRELFVEVPRACMRGICAHPAHRREPLPAPSFIRDAELAVLLRLENVVRELRFNGKGGS